MEELMKQIGIKRKLIFNARETIKRSIEKRNTTGIERQKTTVSKLTSEIDHLKFRIQELRIERSDNDDEIGK